jgi:hypothetical protein
MGRERGSWDVGQVELGALADLVEPEELHHARVAGPAEELSLAAPPVGQLADAGFHDHGAASTVGGDRRWCRSHSERI